MGVGGFSSYVDGSPFVRHVCAVVCSLGARAFLRENQSVVHAAASGTAAGARALFTAVTGYTCFLVSYAYAEE